MPAMTPEQMHKLFVKYFNAGDLEALISLYEPNATMVPFPGEPVTGHAGIRQLLEGFLSRKGRMELTIDKIFSTEDIAIIFSSWSLGGTDLDGQPVHTAGQTSDVVRRQRDGSWLFVIDNPQGTASTKR